MSRSRSLELEDVFREFEPSGADLDPRPYLEQLQVSGLWMYGEEDRIIPAGPSAEILPITVPATPDQCVVVWTSSWTSEKGGVSEFCDPIYTALLTDMKSHFG